MPSTITPLPHLAMLRAHGPQAADLLQAQLTQSMQNWPEKTARMAAMCTPQGRMLADFLLWRETDGAIAMLLDATLAEATLKRLRMFILRLQCKLDDVTPERALFGLLLPQGESPAGLPCPAAAWALLREAGLCVVRLADAPGLRRLLLVAESPEARTAAAQWVATMASGSTEAWSLSEIRAGIGHVTAATAQQFVPQMLNYEALGAVDFKKGCYPGQEIVARTQYRGTIKRRTYRLLSPTVLAPGDEIVHSADPAQPCGLVVNAAPAETGWEALAELKITATTEAGSLHARTVDGPALRLATLPYTLPPQD
ncbi:MAG: folate-binding protein YgfZ [Betaproteobacteria bacterium]|nr:folate-binding protein YgfZ [Betaproteobacteria bacterium]MDE2123665.1 folate-binding protein YgfZ [Betaproteobacteria bacterium]MDE2187740.1 folate-binding protein YgfZ [Betaproteobacteria bacterium]